jgi:hypothetical protein
MFIDSTSLAFYSTGITISILIPIRYLLLADPAESTGLISIAVAA